MDGGRNNMKVILYSTGCPKCRILEQKFNMKNVDYNVVSDEDEMIKKGFMSLPMVEIDGKELDFGEAVRWVNEL